MTERHHETPSKEGLLPFTYKERVLCLQSPVVSGSPGIRTLSILLVYNLQRIFLSIQLEMP